MNKEIVIGFLKEHDPECMYKSISLPLKQKRTCTFCLDVNRDTSLLLTQIGEARKTIDVGIALAPRAELTHYLPYRAAGFTLFHQTGEGESEHIFRVLAEAFTMGYERVLVLSHSIPNLPVKYIERAVVRLRKDIDIVFGPLENGMFYLVGLTRAAFERMRAMKDRPELGFEECSTRKETYRVLRESSVKPHLLPKWYLVKTIEDLGKIHSDASRGKGPKVRWTDRTIRDLHEFIR